ncbi:MAG: DNRLRE domain-containing protein [Clostridia bacterium]|nr:DNRLRE domain-containing protein [Clostridia bacterium]
MKKVLSVLLIFMLLFSAVYAFPFEQASAQEEDTTLKTDTYLPEEEYTEEIYEGTGSLEYAFDGTFIRDYVDNETLDEAGHVARINEEEELNTYVFLNRDGTKSVYYMDDNVRYVDENGETVEKDLTIIRKNKGYTLKANDVKLWFPDVLSDGISVKYDKYHLTLYPQGVADTEEVIIDEYERITYPGVFGENTVLAYTPTLSGLKEDIILSEYTGQLSYDFLIHTHGMRILEEDGKYIVKKPGNGNKETFELGAVQIYDSAGNFCVGEMKITEQNNGSKYILTLIAPEEFLTDPDTVYPVTIDPSITVSDNLNGANAIEDSVIYQGTPNSNYGGFTYLTVGYGDSTYGVGRAIFRLPGLYNSTLYNSLTGSQIVSVKFYTWDASGHSSLPINIYPNVSNSWTESGVKWSNAPGYYTGNDTITAMTANMPSGAYACFDITTLIKWWKSGRYATADCGFIMKNPNETSNLYKKVPCSSETAITDRRPYVVMTYNTSLTITPSTNYLPGGANLQLSVSSNETLQSVVWSSSNTSVAQVSGTGLLSAGTVGRTVITATVTFASGGQQTVQKELYVIYPYNVIRIKNNNSNLYLNVNQGMINDFAQVTQYSSTSNAGTEQERFQQIWKVKYIGDGMYTLRPYHKLDMCLYAYGQENSVRIRQNIKDGSTDSADPNYVIAAYRWSIEYVSGGYVIKHNGESDETLHIENGSTALNAQARVQTYSNSNNYRWTFAPIFSPSSGVILYDTTEQKQIVYNENNEYDISLYIAPKEVKTIADLGLLPVMYSPTKIDQTFSFTIDTSHILYNQETKCFTGVSAGTFDLTGTTSNFSTNNTFTVSMTTTLVPNGVYYLRNWEQDLYASIEDGVLESGTAISQEHFTAESIKQWKITRYKDDYYIIQTEQANAYHIGVSGSSTSENICITSCSDEVPSGLQWKFSKTASGAVKITSKLGESLGRVIAVGSDETHIKHITYTADSNYMDEWLLSRVTTIEDIVLTPQENDMWCWAACIKMASYAYMETPFSVGALVWYKDRGERVLDVDADQKHVTREVGALASETEEILAYAIGAESTHKTYAYGNKIYSPSALQNMLDQGYPVIACMWHYNEANERIGGHALVIYAYNWDDDLGDWVYSIYDPWPSQTGTQLTYTYNDLCAHNSVHNGLYYVWEDIVVFRVDGYDDVIDSD